MTGPLALMAWLLAVWLLLWEEVSAANVLSGLAVVVALTLLFPAERSAPAHRFRPLAAARLAVHFVAKLAEASAIVAWEVVTPRNRIELGVIAVPLRAPTRGLMTLVANAVSLTPGTLSLHVDEARRTLFVHVLHLRNADAVRADVRRLEVLAIRAFAADPHALVDAEGRT